jgi:catechol 2,3-dioxygenase-like lactoylglutathione lyase family enzyme
MWGKPPFFIAGNCAVDVKNLAAVREWYKEKLGFREAPKNRQEDSGRAFVDLYISNDDTFLSLVELEPGASIESRHVIFFTKNLEKAHQWLAGRGVAVEPTSTDSGGNRLCRFQDLEGNNIEVCIEPG